MKNKKIVPFKDKEGNTYKLYINPDVVLKDGMLKAITGIGCTAKKKKRSTFVDNKNGLDGLSEILSGLKGVSCQQSTFVDETNKAKEPGGAVPSPQDVVINSGERT